MFRRRRAVQPTLDPYIARRYEDIAVLIHHDIRTGRGRYNYYAPWLEKMLERLPSAEYREKHSLMPRQPLNAWPEEDEGEREEGKERKEEEEEEEKYQGSCPGVPSRQGLRKSSEPLAATSSRSKQAWGLGIGTEKNVEKAEDVVRGEAETESFYPGVPNSQGGRRTSEPQTAMPGHSQQVWNQETEGEVVVEKEEDEHATSAEGALQTENVSSAPARSRLCTIL